MAGGAVIRGLGVVRQFTRGADAVMAGNTAANDIIVIHCRRRHRLPGHRPRLMTGLAFIAGTEMGGGFAAGPYRIMTADAGSQHLVMIDVGRQYRRPGPGFLFMTGFAGFAGGKMSAGFAGRVIAVMTDDTVVNDGAMINIGIDPGYGVMTGIAFFRSGNMAHFLAAGNNVIMTTAATANGLVVVHRSWRQRLPGGGARLMTGITHFRARHVIC